MGKPKKLILCSHSNHGRRDDFLCIRKHLKKLAPELQVTVSPRKLSFLTKLQSRSANIISILPWEYPIPQGGKVYAGVALTKTEECEALEKIGVPIPRWHLWLKNQDLPKNLADWGNYIIRKPNRGSRGAEVKIIKRERLKWKELKVNYRDISSPPFLQEFIYTGHYPVSYRVGTFFGEPLYSFKIEAPHDSLPLLSRDGFGKAKDNGISQIVANTKKSTYSDCFDEDILQLARQAHQAFPDIPALGVDIIRDDETGQLWVLEVNSSGHTWHLSSDAGRGIQEKNGLNFATQYGGLKRAAEILADRFA